MKTTLYKLNFIELQDILNIIWIRLTTMGPQDKLFLPNMMEERSEYDETAAGCLQDKGRLRSALEIEDDIFDKENSENFGSSGFDDSRQLELTDWSSQDEMHNARARSLQVNSDQLKQISSLPLPIHPFTIHLQKPDGRPWELARVGPYNNEEIAQNSAKELNSGCETQPPVQKPASTYVNGRQNIARNSAQPDEQIKQINNDFMQQVSPRLSDDVYSESCETVRKRRRVASGLEPSELRLSGHNFGTSSQVNKRQRVLHNQPKHLDNKVNQVMNGVSGDTLACDEADFLPGSDVPMYEFRSSKVKIENSENKENSTSFVDGNNKKEEPHTEIIFTPTEPNLIQDEQRENTPGPERETKLSDEEKLEAYVKRVQKLDRQFFEEVKANGREKRTDFENALHNDFLNLSLLHGNPTAFYSELHRSPSDPLFNQVATHDSQTATTLPFRSQEPTSNDTLSQYSPPPPYQVP